MHRRDLCTIFIQNSRLQALSQASEHFEHRISRGKRKSRGGKHIPVSLNKLSPLWQLRATASRKLRQSQLSHKLRITYQQLIKESIWNFLGLNKVPCFEDIIVASSILFFLSSFRLRHNPQSPSPSIIGACCKLEFPQVTAK